MIKKFFSSTHNPTLTPKVIIYLIVLLIAQSIIVYSALLVFAALPQQLTGLVEDYKAVHDTYRGTASMISDQLTENPEEDQQTIKRLQEKFSYPLRLIPSDTPLSEDIRQQFKSDHLAFDDEEGLIYVTYGSSKKLLQMGPVISNDILDASPSAWLPFLLVWSIISAIVFLLLLFLAFSPLWKDAISLRNTAEQLASGDLSSRAPDAQSWLFKPLASVLNRMATKVDRQLHNSKVISHAMAHELRTPVTRLRFGLTMLSEVQTDDEKNRQLIGINKDIEELESLINVSLNFFRMQQQEVVLHKTPISLRQWAQEVCTALQPVKPANIALSCTVEDKQANIDTKIVSIALNNLLLNAFRYASTRVELIVSIEEENLFIEVNDDGSGIPEQARKEIFTPFSRLDDSRTRQTGGYGLGLAYVKLIAEYHYGSVQVTDNPWGGARFILQLGEIG